MFWVSLYFYVSTSHANINCVEIKTKMSKVVGISLIVGLHVGQFFNTSFSGMVY